VGKGLVISLAMSQNEERFTRSTEKRERSELSMSILKRMG
jgi:hypothetical protein